MEEEKKESKYKGYKPQKGVTPPWDPFNPEKRKGRITIRERKFLAALGTSGNLSEAYRSVYTVSPAASKQLEAARVTAAANKVLDRIKAKDPALVAHFTFADITPEFVRKGILDLYNRAKEKGDMHIEKGTLELMGKIHAMFTDKVQSETKIKEVVDHVYRESLDDMPRKDNRLSVEELDQKLGRNIGQA